MKTLIKTFLGLFVVFMLLANFHLNTNKQVNSNELKLENLSALTANAEDDQPCGFPAVCGYVGDYEQLCWNCGSCSPMPGFINITIDGMCF
jgi:hypothetical protein